MDHGVYLKLTRGLSQDDTQNRPGFTKLSFWVENYCDFDQLYITVILFSASDKSHNPGAN
jgi:hypothetical protein